MVCLMQTWVKVIIVLSLLNIIMVATTLIYLQYFSRRTLTISTSVDDTELLEEIRKAFEAKYPITLNIISTNTSATIQQAQNGEVDLILIDSPPMEKTFLEQGYGICRKIIAYNFFVIVGSQEDPAGIWQLNATEALKRIVEYGRNQIAHPFSSYVWVSRGDNSGTHQKEKSLWAAAGCNYTMLSTEAWYNGDGGDMGKTLLKVEQNSAYTLSDIGTYLKYVKDNIIHLEALITEEEALLNTYSAIAMNQTRYSCVNFNDSITFIKFLISNETQQLIENYGKSTYGQSLFYAAVQPLKQNSPQPIVQWIKDYAFFNGSECPPAFRDDHPELYDGG